MQTGLKSKRERPLPIEKLLQVNGKFVIRLISKPCPISLTFSDRIDLKFGIDNVVWVRAQLRPAKKKNT